MPPPRTYWVPSPKFTGGHPQPLEAVADHRMVGNLKSCDTTFLTPVADGGRVASTNFGIGHSCGRSGHPVSAVHVHQYVLLGNMAWGNGNWDPTGRWDDFYSTVLINSRTISIEHHDCGGCAHPNRGIVTEAILAADIEFHKLLLRGDLAEMKALGIRFRPEYELAISRELKRVRSLLPTQGARRIVHHNFIAGRLKPSCWLPWEDDRVGFPQARYLREIMGVTPAPLPSPTEVEVVKSFAVPKAPQVARIVAGGVLYADTSLTPGPANIDDIQPSREMPYVGLFPGKLRAVEYVKPDGTHTGAAYFVKDAHVARKPDGTLAIRNVTDPTPHSAADLAAAKKTTAGAVKKAGIEALSAEAAKYGG